MLLLDNKYNCLSTICNMDKIICGRHRRVQPDKCYFTVQITGINFECSL